MKFSLLRLSSLVFIGFFLSVKALNAFYVSTDPNQLQTDVKGNHEEITRQAWQLAQVDFALSTDEKQNTNSSEFNNKPLEILILGNYATDVPGGFYPLSLPKMWGYPKNIINWHNNPIGQHLHFLRNKTADSQLESAAEACANTKKDILSVLTKALNLWLENTDKTQALFLIGHGSHIIQDSFSPAHTQRSTSNNYNLLGLCYYGQTMTINQEQICHHQETDGRDLIWLIDGDSKAIELAQREWLGRGQTVNSVPNLDAIKRGEQSPEYLHSLFTHEARLAEIATAKYFYTLASFFKSLNTNLSIQANTDLLTAKLNLLFDGPGENLQVFMPAGILNCSAIKNEPNLLKTFKILKHGAKRESNH